MIFVMGIQEVVLMNAKNINYMKKKMKMVTHINIVVIPKEKLMERQKKNA